jgi:periplasmic copper chaperone A
LIDPEMRAMRRLILELLTAMALTLGSILALSLQARAGDVAVADAFARASALPSATSGGVYLTFVNAGSAPDVLIGISTDAAQMVMLHQTVIENGVAKMTMLDELPIPAGGKVELSPGGSHIMLEGLKAPLKQGQAITLKLTFKRAGGMTVVVPVGNVAAMAP